MHSLETLIRLNAEFGQPESHNRQLRRHSRIISLRGIVATLPVDAQYRRWLFRSINRYADQLVARPEPTPDEGWDDLEALQQVTLSDMMESLHGLSP